MRALTGMLALLLMVAAASARGAPGSKALFAPCGAVLTKSEIETLREERISAESFDSAGCLRLTNREFVFFTGGNGKRFLLWKTPVPEGLP